MKFKCAPIFDSKWAFFDDPLTIEAIDTLVKMFIDKDFVKVAELYGVIGRIGNSQPIPPSNASVIVALILNLKLRFRTIYLSLSDIQAIKMMNEINARAALFSNLWEGVENLTDLDRLDIDYPSASAGCVTFEEDLLFRLFPKGQLGAKSAYLKGDTLSFMVLNSPLPSNYSLLGFGVSIPQQGQGGGVAGPPYDPNYEEEEEGQQGQGGGIAELLRILDLSYEGEEEGQQGQGYGDGAALLLAQVSNDVRGKIRPIRTFSELQPSDGQMLAQVTLDSLLSSSMVKDKDPLKWSSFAIDLGKKLDSQAQAISDDPKSAYFGKPPSIVKQLAIQKVLQDLGIDGNIVASLVSDTYQQLKTSIIHALGEIGTLLELSDDRLDDEGNPPSSPSPYDVALSESLHSYSEHIHTAEQYMISLLNSAENLVNLDKEALAKDFLVFEDGSFRWDRESEWGYDDLDDIMMYFPVSYRENAGVSLVVRYTILATLGVVALFASSARIRVWLREWLVEDAEKEIAVLKAKPIELRTEEEKQRLRTLEAQLPILKKHLATAREYDLVGALLGGGVTVVKHATGAGVYALYAALGLGVAWGIHRIFFNNPKA